MKTLSEFKRACKVGLKVHTFHHGNGFQEALDMGIRPVSIVQSNSIAFRTERGTDSWIEWPKASQCTIENETLTVLKPDGTPMLTYTILGYTDSDIEAAAERAFNRQHPELNP